MRRLFKQVADKIFNLLQNSIFVAHNVNFDYSFIKHQLQEAGHALNNTQTLYRAHGQESISGF